MKKLFGAFRYFNMTLLLNKALAVALLLVLSSCALPKGQPINIDGQTYHDPNNPSIKVQFPFDIRLFKEEFIRRDNELVKKAVLISERPKRFIHINKYQTTGRYYYTGVDLPLRENVYYKDKFINGNCSVYIAEQKGKYFLAGDIIIHPSENRTNQIIISQPIFLLGEPDFWWNENMETAKLFVDDVKFICKQKLKNRGF